jgi:hypothetical protein
MYEKMVFILGVWTAEESGAIHVWCVMTREGAKKRRKYLSKRRNFSSEMRKSPVILDFFASRHCINNEV